MKLSPLFTRHRHNKRSKVLKSHTSVIFVNNQTFPRQPMHALSHRTIMSPQKNIYHFLYVIYQFVREEIYVQNIRWGRLEYQFYHYLPSYSRQTFGTPTINLMSYSVLYKIESCFFVAPYYRRETKILSCLHNCTDTLVMESLNETFTRVL